ncbi:hypothetical protein [Rubellicoccus peritrichatus]|uniref:Uncharacterized protein n=1 Tax=Rubellicoccus peritrichatus TaxID=3080537 RepID=A0AAQ3QV22_9BACT|nr:hypothetical protein [Puniceicoccus sp. CR14]WOO40393.1 hypothetical protein RZN69_17375 [Puniceicoccus sp. CR14]WOO40442.1 hypothetical protein RZN69_17620 [Puniceicoccus sp. CR14]WOO40491.1 hypothetical protein RZN69_17865 [Puniceicoccus sp. CR14]WOO40540.1 hypothetical protein RZN69_18110 [Puniceicoccus sp. CR14]
MDEDFDVHFYPCCENYCRDWHETNGGEYPPSDHSPMCENFELKEYDRFDLNGTFVIDSVGAFTEFLTDPEYEGGIVTTIKLTEDQFEKLPEFEGF